MFSFLRNLVNRWLPKTNRRCYNQARTRLQFEELEKRELLAVYLWKAPPPAPDAPAPGWAVAANWQVIGAAGAEAWPSDASDTAIFNPGQAGVGTNTSVNVSMPGAFRGNVTIGQIIISPLFTGTINLASSLIINPSSQQPATMPSSTADPAVAFTGPGWLVLEGGTVFNWGGGTIAGTVAPGAAQPQFVVGPSATLNITGGINEVLSGRKLVDNGRINWTGLGNLFLANNAQIALQSATIPAVAPATADTFSDPVFNITAGNVRLAQLPGDTSNVGVSASTRYLAPINSGYVGSNIVVNPGTLNSVVIAVPFESNNATLALQSGSLMFSGARFDFAGTWGGGGETVATAGTFQIAANAMVFLATPTVSLRSVNFMGVFGANGAGTLQIGFPTDGSDQGIFPRVTVAGSVGFTNVQDFSVTMRGTGNIIVAAGGTFNVLSAQLWNSPTAPTGGLNPRTTARLTMTIQQNAVLNIQSFLGLGISIINNGTVNLSSDMVVSGAATITNNGVANGPPADNAGLFDIQGDFSIYGLSHRGQSPQFILNRNAVLRKSAGAGTANFRIDVQRNGGFIQPLAGMLQFFLPVALGPGGLGIAPGAALAVGGDFQQNGGAVYAGGTLDVSGAISLAGGSIQLKEGTLDAASLTNSGGLIEGSGTVNADVTNSSDMAPGSASSAAAIAINGTFTQTSTGLLEMALGGSSVDDLLDVNGGAVLAGSLFLDTLPSFDGSSATIISASSISGTFNNLPEGSVISVDGDNYQLSYASDGGTEVTLTNVSNPITLTASQSSASYGQSVTYTATVAGDDPTGNVEFFVDGSATPFATVALSGGSASASLSGLAVGGHVITAYYVGDANNSPSTVNFTQQVVDNLPTAVNQSYSVAASTQVSGNMISDDTGNGPDADADGEGLSVLLINGTPANVGSPVTLPSGATLTVNSNGSFTYDPTTSSALSALGYGASATDSFQYTILDGQGGTSTAEVTITINGVNQTPYAAPQVYNVTANNVVFGNVIYDDTGNGPDVDPEPGDTLQLTQVTAEIGGTQTALTLGQPTQLDSGATLTVYSDGDFVYVPGTSSTFQGLEDGDSAVDGFTYTVADGSGGTASASVTLNVFGTPSTVVPGGQAMNENTSLVLSAADGNGVSLTNVDASAGDVFQEVVSVQNGTLTLVNGLSNVTFVDGSSNGSSTLIFTGTVGEIDAALDGMVYQPNANFVGSDLLQVSSVDQSNGYATLDSVDVAVDAVATQWVVISQPSTVVAGTPFALTIAAEDGQGNIAYDYNGTISISVLNGPGPLTDTNDDSAPIQVTVTDGVAAIGDLVLTTAGSYDLQVGDGNLQSTSDWVYVQAGAVTQLVVTTQPSAAYVNNAFDLEVSGEDAYGNVVPYWEWNTSSVQVSMSSGPSGATLSGPTSIQPDWDGTSVEVSGLSLDTAGSYTLSISGSDNNGNSLTAATASVTAVAVTPTQWVVTNQPMSLTAGMPFNLTVTAEDNQGDVDTAYSGTVTLTVASGPGSLSGTVTADVVDGVATIPGAVLTTAGSYDVQVGDGNLQSTSDWVYVQAGAVTQLVVTTQPSAAYVNNAFDLEMSGEDAYGNVVPYWEWNTSSVQVSMSSGPSGATLSGPTSIQPDWDGTSIEVSGLSLDTAGSYTLSISGSDNNGNSLTAATASVTAVAVTATQWVVTNQPMSVTAGMPFNLTVTAEDNQGDVDTAYSGTVTLTVASGPGTLSGTVTADAVDGVATIPGAVLTTAGSYDLQVGDGNLQSASDWVYVQAGAVTQLVVTTQPSAAYVNNAFDLEVSGEDAYGNVVPYWEWNTSSVQVSVSSGPSGATLSGPTSIQPDWDGTSVEVSGLSLDTAGSYTLSISGSDNNGNSLTAATASVTAVAVTATQWVVSNQPGTVTAGSGFGLTVIAEDGQGDVDTAYSGTVTLSVASGPGSVSGTTTATIVDGVATISGAVLTMAGSYDLQVGDGNLQSATASVSVLAGSVTAVSADCSTSTSGQTVTFTATVAAGSGFGGTPTGTVQFQIDGVNFGGPAALNSSGQASISTSGLTVGNHTIVAVYSGDSDFAGSDNSASPFAETVNPQTAEVQSTNGGGYSSTATVNWTNPTTAGDMLYVSLVVPQGVTVTLPTGFTLQSTQNMTGLSENITIYTITEADAPSSTAASFALSGTGTWSVVGMEVAGYAGILDQQSGQTGTSTAVDSGTTGTTTVPSEIAIAVVTTVMASGSSASGWTNATDSGSPDAQQQLFYQVISAPGAQDFATTIGPSENWAAQLETFS